MENKELMQALEECSRLLLEEDYKAFVEYVNNSKFKTELIAEFEDEYEDAVEEYGVSERVVENKHTRLLSEERLREKSQKEADEELENVMDEEEFWHNLPDDDRPFIDELTEIVEAAADIRDDISEYDVDELKKLLDTFKQLINNLRNHEDSDYLESQLEELLSEFGFEDEKEVEHIFTSQISLVKEIEKEREKALKAESCFKARDYEGFIENYDSDEDNYSNEFLDVIGDLHDCYVEIKELVQAYKQGIITKEQMQNFEYKEYKDDSRFSTEYKYPKALDYIIANANYKLENETRKLKNGIEITIYNAGNAQDYILPRTEKGAKLIFVYDGYEILGLDYPKYYGCFESAYDCELLKKVKIKFEDGQEYVGLLSEKAIETIEETKILPIVDGVIGECFRYSLINLENGKSYEISDEFFSIPHMKEKFVEGYFADRNQCVNLKTMQPLLDKNGEKITGRVCYNFSNGICVVDEGYYEDDKNDYSRLKAYNKKGELVDEIYTAWSDDYDCDLAIEKYEENEQIIYENGNFYLVDKNGNKQLMEAYTPTNIVNPM